MDKLALRLAAVAMLLHAISTLVSAVVAWRSDRRQEIAQARYRRELDQWRERMVRRG